ncbi:HTH-type transcriptional regulator EthR [Delftia tsuruhatensis]|uniref:TetR/AcrR family transcriptional regulator n=1 Tax=Delftia tsuruhatensis TaxID=180282 RepID=UPI001E77A875|nr:TetR/AcrR family transcriptional regulator [Delftia tsuruhatensis]CAB5698530.1 HTH-type transcriptional regulator EthR [Delftia tsuruhatensis]CAC9676440.1 HTH-type transcriptional regulator EthR [Delftia tsuruhatensis]
MARGRSSGYDDQRELILGHAAALFARSGYPGTSMNEVAQACGLSKPTIYHYFRDKYALLVDITDGHMTRLQALVDEVQALELPPEPRLRMLIERFVQEYAHARHAHRVLTEDVRFLQDDDRQRVLGKERAVVEAFAQAVAQLRPDAGGAGLSKALAMLLFGMMNWMFTWLRPDGTLDHEAMAPVVADLFLGGLPAVQTPGKPGHRNAGKKVVTTVNCGA